MNRNYAITEYTDHQLFEADNRDRLENPDMWPPVKAASISGRDDYAFLSPQTGEPSDRGVRYVFRGSERATLMQSCAPLLERCATQESRTKTIKALKGFVQDVKYEDLLDRTVRAEKIKAYGEGFDGEARNISEMTQAERLIVEECNNGSGRVQRKAEAVPQKNKYDRPEWIARRLAELEYDFQDADILIEAWRTIEATPKMVEAFIAGMKTQPQRDWIEYFTSLAYELAKVETPAPDCERPILETGYDEAVPAAYSHNLARRWEIDPDNLDDEGAIYQIIEPDDRVLPSSAEFAYVTINTDPGEDKWIETQPEWLPKGIAALRACKTQDQLSKIAKFAWKDKRLATAKPQTRKAFWGWHKAKRAEFRRAGAMSPHRKTTRLIMKRIESVTNETLSDAGSWLYELTKGLVSLPGYSPGKDDITMLWAAYKKRKREIINA